MTTELRDLQDGLIVGDESSGDYTEFETTGFRSAKGSAKAFRDEYPVNILEAGGAAAPTQANHTIGGVQRRLWSFDGGAIEERLSGSFEIPHDYMYLEDIEIHVHIRPDDNTSGNVELFFDWEYSAVNSAPQAETSLSVVIPIDANTQYHHYVKEIGILPPNGFTLGDKIGFNLRRTPSGTNDTYTGEVLFEQIAMHIPIDTDGSRLRYSK